MNKGQRISKVTKLRESLARGELSHALLLEAPDHSIPELEPLFRSILCQNQNACGKCESCLIQLDLEGTERRHPDFWIVRPDAEKENYSVEQVREWESRFLYLSKNISPKKLLVVTQAEKLAGTQNAPANALLKILEEPRAHTHLILVSANTLRLLATIRSRCLKVNLRAELSPKEELKEDFSEILDALWGRFGKDSHLSNAVWWKDKSDRIAKLEGSVPQLWKKATSMLAHASQEEALNFWTSWKHYEDFLWALRRYGNPPLHWLNFKRKVLTGQTWRISKLFG